MSEESQENFRGEFGYLRAFRTMKEISSKRRNGKYLPKDSNFKRDKSKERRWVEDNAKRRRELDFQEKKRLKKEDARIKSELEKYKTRKIKLNPLKNDSTLKKLRNKKQTDNEKYKKRKLKKKSNSDSVGLFLNEMSRNQNLGRRSPTPSDSSTESSNNSSQNAFDETPSVISEPLPLVNKRPGYGNLKTFRTLSYVRSKKKSKHRKRPWRMYHKKREKKLQCKPKWKKKLATGYSRQIETLENDLEKLDRVLLDKRKNLKIFNYNERLIRNQIKVLERDEDGKGVSNIPKKTKRKVSKTITLAERPRKPRYPSPINRKEFIKLNPISTREIPSNKILSVERSQFNLKNIDVLASIESPTRFRSKAFGIPNNNGKIIFDKESDILGLLGIAKEKKR